METTRNSVKVKLGIRVMKLGESLVCWEVTATYYGSIRVNDIIDIDIIESYRPCNK